MTFNIRVPTGMCSFKIECGVSATELMDSVVTLTVNVKRKDKV